MSKTHTFCMYCGKDSEKYEHTACEEPMRRFAEDLRRAPKGEAYRVMQAAENGHYGRAPKPVKKKSFRDELKKL